MSISAALRSETEKVVSGAAKSVPVYTLSVRPQHPNDTLVCSSEEACNYVSGASIDTAFLSSGFVKVT